MNIFKSLSDQVFSFPDGDFESVALQIFNFQAEENPVYKVYIEHLGVEPSTVSNLSEIPFLPIEFFKNHTVKSADWNPEIHFESSGTTGAETSKHYVRDLTFYLENCVRGFNQHYGNVKDYVWLALLPSYLERSHSGLVAMANHFIETSGQGESGFYLNNFEELLETLRRLKAKGKKTILLGVTFALLDLADKMDFQFEDLIIMETGGMKGRREEMIRSDVHQVLKTAFGTSHLHSEYGMTELFSQAYSKGEGIFLPARTMKVMTREINDPFSISDALNSGGLNVIDLANLHSCSFIETKDLGRVHKNGSFEVLGRIDNSDIRGCNLMLA